MPMTKTGRTRKYRPLLKLPPLSPDEYHALSNNIAVNGVMVPILVDEEKRIIDGSYRKQIAEELEYECPEIVEEQLTDEEKRTLRRALNLARRQLTAEQKRQVIADQLSEKPSRSNRWIAKQLGVSHHTVKSVRAELEAGGQIAHLDRLTGEDGKLYSKSKTYWTRVVDSGDKPMRHFPTPEKATRALLERERFRGRILEPACGDGALADVLRDHGYTVNATDLRTGRNFLKRRKSAENIVTNPPWSDSSATDFARHALKLARRKTALLVPLYFLEGVIRHELFTAQPLKAVYIFSRRLVFGRDDKIPFGCCWMVWDTSYKGEPAIGWILG